MILNCNWMICTIVGSVVCVPLSLYGLYGHWNWNSLLNNNRTPFQKDVDLKIESERENGSLGQADQTWRTQILTVPPHGHQLSQGDIFNDNEILSKVAGSLSHIYGQFPFQL